MGNESGARVLSGLALAKKLREQARQEAAQISARGAPPRLRVFLVGENPASKLYITSKSEAARQAGIEVETAQLPSGASADRLLAEISRANSEESVDGILVQLPLESPEIARRVFDALDPSKDVDGFHPENVGLLHQGRPRFVPCTPAGILALLDSEGFAIAGRRAVVIGRSEIVGKPMAALLTLADATVTLCHSKSEDLPAICREAEILIAAVGKPGLITRDWVRKGAVVVDVGISRFESLEAVPEKLRRHPRIRAALETRGRVLLGDVDYDDVAPVAGGITPVPGGVGPLTVAMLLKNTVKAARLRRTR